MSVSTDGMRTTNGGVRNMTELVHETGNRRKDREENLILKRLPSFHRIKTINSMFYLQTIYFWGVFRYLKFLTIRLSWGYSFLRLKREIRSVDVFWVDTTVVTPFWFTSLLIMSSVGQYGISLGVLMFFVRTVDRVGQGSEDGLRGDSRMSNLVKDPQDKFLELN